MRERRIGIVGGGVAGINAALHASRLGARVLLFEALPHLGGRVAGSTEFDTGRHLALDIYREFLAFTDLLGTTDALPFQPLEVGARREGRNLFLPLGRAGALARMGSLFASPFVPAARRFPSLLALLRSLKAAPRERRDGELLGEAGAFAATEGVTAAQAWRRLRWPGELVDRLGRPALLAICNGPPESAAAGPLLLALRRLLASGPLQAGWPSEDQGLVVTARGDQALRCAGVELRTGARVTGLRRTGEGWTIGVGEERLEVDRVVLTLPPWQLAALAEEERTQSLADAAEGVRALGIATLRQPFAEARTLPGPLGEGGPLEGIWFSSPLPEGGVLVERVVSGLDPASPPDLEEWRAGFEGLARTVADARDPRGEVELRYYPRATPLLEPGTPRPVVDRGGGFYYASDWCASGLPPTLEAAAWAGRVAGEAAAGR